MFCQESVWSEAQDSQAWLPPAGRLVYVAAQQWGGAGGATGGEIKGQKSCRSRVSRVSLGALPAPGDDEIGKMRGRVSASGWRQEGEQPSNKHPSRRGGGVAATRSTPSSRGSSRRREEAAAKLVAALDRVLADERAALDVERLHLDVVRARAERRARGARRAAGARVELAAVCCCCVGEWRVVGGGGIGRGGAKCW